ncbi:hypothetical protein GOP47_0014703 [Adiantum capillus-veneris]|uniref:Uncharacterized protein n=1 Tax=Adiantum capillus-veneris TaxID=13818 RepID=A0A9D4ZEG3_ADICA|nr:hypothetical protein GOP47_0014703 [Adiantum capillus-veneris]
MDPLVREALLPDLLSSASEDTFPFRSNPSRTPSLRQHSLERVKEEIWCFEPSCWVPLRKDCLPSPGVTLFWLEERKRGALALAMVCLGVSFSCGQPALAEAIASPNVYFVPSEHVVNDGVANLSSSEMLELQSLRISQSAHRPESNGTVSLKAEGRREARDSLVYGKESMKRSPDVKAATALSDGLSATGGERIAKAAVIPLLTRVLQHLGGGGFAGAVGATVVYPLDTIKTRLQAQSKNDRKYKNVVDCFRQLLLEEGLGSFYNGLVPQLLGIAPEKALKLTVNEVILATLEQHLPGVRLWALEIIAGGGGGFSQVLVTNPMEIVKLRLQIQSKVTSPRGLWDIIRELGLHGLYNGSGITMARDVPSSAIFFACYTLITQMYPDQRFWAGFVAAIPATVLVTPLDVIKTRLQMETPPGQEPYKDAFHCCRVLLQQEGLKGLFKGGLLRVLRTCPQFGITLMIYSLFCDGC